MHFHRDVLTICDTFPKYVLKPQPDDIFVGSPPLAFTFGLGGVLLFPMRVGASTLLLEKTSAEILLQAIARASRDNLLHRADALSPDGRSRRRLTTSRACANASPPARPCRCRSSRRSARRPGSASSTGSARPRCCTSSSRRRATTSGPAPPARRSPATRPWWSTRTATRCRATRSGGSRCAARPAAAISPTSGRRPMCRSAGTSRATPIAWMRTAISGTRRAPTT